MNLLQRLSNAGYAGIPTGGNPNYGMVQNGQVAMPQPSPLQAMAQQPQLNPAEQQALLLKQLGQGANATGYRSMKAPSAIPLNTVLENDSGEYHLHAEPMASGNKYRALNAEVSGPLGGGELSLQGGMGRMFGRDRSPSDIEMGARYTKGFAGGGKVNKNYGYGPEQLFFDNDRGIPTNKTTNAVNQQQQINTTPVSAPAANVQFPVVSTSAVQPVVPNIAGFDFNDIPNIQYDEYGRQLTPPGSRFPYIGPGGGGGGPVGDPNTPYEYFASGGFVDGQSLVEPIDENTQQQINAMMSNGGLASTGRQDLASFAKGGDVDVNDFMPPLQQQQPSAIDILKDEFAKRGLDFNRFVASPPVMQQALKNAESMGVGGDTMLAHINPREAELLKKHGGSGDVNPNTGLPMFAETDYRLYTPPTVTNRYGFGPSGLFYKYLDKVPDTAQTPQSINSVLSDIASSVIQDTINNQTGGNGGGEGGFSGGLSDTPSESPSETPSESTPDVNVAETEAEAQALENAMGMVGSPSSAPSSTSSAPSSAGSAPSSSGSAPSSTGSTSNVGGALGNTSSGGFGLSGVTGGLSGSNVSGGLSSAAAGLASAAAAQAAAQAEAETAAEAEAASQAAQSAANAAANSIGSQTGFGGDIMGGSFGSSTANSGVGQSNDVSGKGQTSGPDFSGVTSAQNADAMAALGDAMAAAAAADATNSGSPAGDAGGGFGGGVAGGQSGGNTAGSSADTTGGSPAGDASGGFGGGVEGGQSGGNTAGSGADTTGGSPAGDASGGFGGGVEGGGPGGGEAKKGGFIKTKNRGPLNSIYNKKRGTVSPLKAMKKAKR